MWTPSLCPSTVLGEDDGRVFHYRCLLIEKKKRGEEKVATYCKLAVLSRRPTSRGNAYSGWLFISPSLVHVLIAIGSTIVLRRPLARRPAPNGSAVGSDRGGPFRCPSRSERWSKAVGLKTIFRFVVFSSVKELFFDVSHQTSPNVLVSGLTLVNQ